MTVSWSLHDIALPAAPRLWYLSHWQYLVGSKQAVPFQLRRTYHSMVDWNSPSEIGREAGECFPRFSYPLGLILYYQAIDSKLVHAQAGLL